jgi:hypothetical protein
MCPKSWPLESAVPSGSEGKGLVRAHDEAIAAIR